MRRFFLLPLLLLVAPAAIAQDKLSDQTLKRMKEVTVFLRGGGGMTSGFLIRKEGDTGYVVTTALGLRGIANAGFSAVFNSGVPKEEKGFPAVLVAEDNQLGLAVFKVDGKALPAPFPGTNRAKLKETLPVFILGFPFGDALATSGQNPAVTVGKGAVTSLRTDDAGEVLVIQLDAEIGPGQSGGPIVDASGALVGVALASLSGNKTGFAIPLRNVDELFHGRIESFGLRVVEIAAGTIKLSTLFTPCDPLGKVKDASLLYCPRSKVKGELKADPKTGWGPVAPDMTAVPVAAKGNWTAAFSLTGDVKNDVEYVTQARWTRGDGKVVFSAPEGFVAEFQLGDPARKKEGVGWLGKDAATSAAMAKAPGPSAGSNPIPVPTGELLRGSTETTPTSTLTSLRFNTSFLTCLTYSTDEKAVFALDWPGVVRRISLPEFREERKLVIGKDCAWMERSKEGLVVLCPGLQELFVLEESTLAIKTRIAIGTHHFMATSPGTSLAFLYNQARDEPSIVDLAKGVIARRIPDGRFSGDGALKVRKHRQGSTLLWWTAAQVTPDGKYLLLLSGGNLHRLRIEATDLVYEEFGPAVFQNSNQPTEPSALVLSPDSQWITTEKGLDRADIPIPPPPAGGSYRFKVTDLQKPDLILPKSIRAFDAGGETGYSVKATVVSFAGAPEKLMGPFLGDSPQWTGWKLLPSRESGRLLAIFGADHCYWMEIKK